MAHDDVRYMRMALEACRAGIAAGQAPFGACIVRDGQVLAAAHNQVWRDLDPTAHAEVRAIRLACKAEASVHLEGATIYSSTEPCPMCFAAIHWARIGRIVYAAGIDDAVAAGFNELLISNRTLQQLGGSGIEVTGDLLRAEAQALFAEFRRRQGRTY